MSHSTARIIAMFLILSLFMAEDLASSAVLFPHTSEQTRQAVQTSYWPLIQIQPIAEPRSSLPQPDLQNTGSIEPSGLSLGAPIYLEPEQPSAGLEGAERIAREVYVQGEFILPITQQPVDRNTYVSLEPGMLTQFGMASRNGVTGLLAHNYLSGALFFLLDVGQEIDVLYANGQIQHYQISEIMSFQKLRPSDLHSDYLDMQTGKFLSTSEVYRTVYRGQHHLALQTCLEQNGNLSWGLYFVIAIPLQKT
jgi:hypothetical protein